MANLRKQVDVSNFIARIFESLLNLLPAQGLHRQVTKQAPVPSPHPTPPWSSRVPMLRGEDTVMVRPYLVSHERRRGPRSQRVCSAWPVATHGANEAVR
ncbi:hypothetical protein BX264_2942 [Streptomyces sp. 2333.5]|nr:hypothetical protein BX264_2942 [Streptomyces sp. 2333.5]SED17248.1 hypothetical protein SAMN05428943_3082 [Streptomyces sp. 2314.4]SEE05048.1 hypothetical protein SAMN05428942_3045 [Streptomyces sp. 2112.2]